MSDELLDRLRAALPVAAAAFEAGTGRVGLVVVDEVNGFATVGAGNLAPPAPNAQVARMIEETVRLARAFTARGHEPAAHGYLWCDHFRMAEGEERATIARAVAAIRDATGERPVGWYCRYAPSVNTRRLLVEEGGFQYDSDSYADELPYWVRAGDRPHLVIPYQLDANDAKFFRGPGWSGGNEFFEYLRDSVDMLLKERRPRMLSVGLHPRIIGRPGRAAALERFLEHVARTPGIAVMRRADIARWWRQECPA